MKNNSVVIAAGGTGGHIFPAQALAETLVEQKIPFTFICDERTEKFLQEPLKSAKIFKISATKISGNPFRKILALIKLLFSTLSVLFFLLKNRPTKIIGFGGYPSFPSLLAGFLLFIPIYIHEQNSVLGRVNKLFTPLCKKIFITFPFTKGLKSKYTTKVIVIGNLTRSAIVPKELKKIPNKPFTILVIGGSQGARSISTIIPEAIASLPEATQKNLKIYQQCREENLEEANNTFRSFKGQFTVKTFYQNIGELMNEADLIVSRAGASSIAEIITMSKASILIPYPHATDDHQYHNAKFLADNDSCILMKESDLTKKSFAHEIEKILYDKSILTLLSKNIKRLYIENSNQKFTSELLDQPSN